MKRPVKQLMLSLVIGITAVSLSPHVLKAQAEADSKATIRKLLERLENVERDLARLKLDARLIPEDKKEQRLLMLLETPYFGRSYYGPNGGRFFVAKLIFINLTPKPVTIKREQISLDADETTYPLVNLPPQMQNQGFQIGSQNYQLRNMQAAPQVVVPSGGTGSTWVVFTQIPAGNHIPKLSLKLNMGSRKPKINVNEMAAQSLGLEIERIGPRGSLALITISGAFNTINVGTLVDTLEELTTKKVARAVIRWTDSAPTLNAQLYSWLLSAANQSGSGTPLNNNSFPPIPASIRELHLAKVPNNGGAYSSSKVSPRIHKTDADAVIAALKTAYEVLPRDELLREIENGSTLTRAAALVGGGGRLPSENLPLLLKLADDNDPSIQRAAIYALRHFGDKPAIEKLREYALKGTEPTATIALEGLAASRFSVAHETLMSILKNEAPQSRKAIVKILAVYPRPIWSETIYDFVKDPDSTVAIEALRALIRIGHPKLVDLLEELLESGGTVLRNEAFNSLSSRTDRKSEEIAIMYTLKHMKNSPPTPQMFALLTRTKDPRAVQPLMTLLERGGANRAAIINTLAQIGDHTVAELLVGLYPKLNNNERRTTLTALQQMKSPHFRKLAGQALLTNDGSLVSTAVQGLQADGSPAAIQLLIKAFESSGNTYTWSYISNALGALATPEARNALRKARESRDANKRNYANNALRNLRRRSPGYQYIAMAQNLARQKPPQWDKVIEQYNHAIDFDPQLPEAFSGRGNALLRQNKHAEALKDFTKAMEIDPYNSQGVTGRGICLVIAGDFEGGIKLVEDSRKKFTNDQLFAYNAACVYGRALAHVRKNEKIAERDKKIGAYRQKAILELQRSVKLGFREYSWMKEDPDLKSLHDEAEFKKISNPSPTADPTRIRGANPFSK